MSPFTFLFLSHPHFLLVGTNRGGSCADRHRSVGLLPLYGPLPPSPSFSSFQDPRRHLHRRIPLGLLRHVQGQIALFESTCRRWRPRGLHETHLPQQNLPEPLDHYDRHHLIVLSHRGYRGLVTMLMIGLYAESHGIVANDFWDPLWNEEYNINNATTVCTSFCHSLITALTRLDRRRIPNGMAANHSGIL